MMICTRLPGIFFFLVGFMLTSLNVITRPQYRLTRFGASDSLILQARFPRPAWEGTIVKVTSVSVVSGCAGGVRANADVIFRITASDCHTVETLGRYVLEALNNDALDALRNLVEIAAHRWRNMPADSAEKRAITAVRASLEWRTWR